MVPNLLRMESDKNINRLELKYTVDALMYRVEGIRVYGNTVGPLIPNILRMESDKNIKRLEHGNTRWRHSHLWKYCRYIVVPILLRIESD